MQVVLFQQFTNSFFDTEFSRGVLRISSDEMIELGQKSTPQKETKGFQQNPNNTRDTQEHFLFHQQHTNDNFKLFWVRKKSPRKWNRSQKNPEIENFKPPKIFQLPPSLEIRSTLPPPLTPPSGPTHLSR